MKTGIRAAAQKIRGLVRHVRTYFRLRRGESDLKLHLGCGQRRLKGFVNIDHNFSPAVDYRHNITAGLPCPERTVGRIEAYHVIEHIPYPRVHEVLDYWRRLLRPGGTLVLECPDFAADVDEYLGGNTERLYSIFGRQRFPGDAHHWGYTNESLPALLAEVGYVNVRTPPALDYHAENEPCIRVEADAPSPSASQGAV